MASGWSASETYDAEHWDPNRASAGDRIHYVDVEFDRILDPVRVPPLSTDTFTTGPLSHVYWAIPASGTHLAEDAATELEHYWEDYLRRLPASPSMEGDARPARRNPPWQRDELILALDLYAKHGGRYVSEDHEEIIGLSQLLKVLPLHTDRPDLATFRNPNGVSMKLLNFRRFDPNQEGSGLTRGNMLEREVWEQYAMRPDLLRRIAEAIRSGYAQPESGAVGGDIDEEEGFPEGKILYRMHRTREREPNLVKRVKLLAKRNHGRLFCQVCGFDFVDRYGPLGEDFIECHHTKPLSELADERDTRIKDIATVCANCHRMIHRKRPWLSVEDLSSILQRP
jgi:5-methylcytosine-specific restriction protein A